LKKLSLDVIGELVVGGRTCWWARHCENVLESVEDVLGSPLRIMVGKESLVVT